MTTLIDQYRQMHDAGHFPGSTMLKYESDIHDMIMTNSVIDVLDYGCGKALAWPSLSKLWGVIPYLYDPATHHDDRETVIALEGVDMLICTDVLEHIPEPDVSKTINEMLGYANKCAFISICCRPARKTLPDGRNCHLTIRPPEWWKAHFRDIDDLDLQLVFEE
jgi:hypothetical protein